MLALISYTIIVYIHTKRTKSFKKITQTLPATFAGQCRIVQTTLSGRSGGSRKKNLYLSPHINMLYQNIQKTYLAWIFLLLLSSTALHARQSSSFRPYDLRCEHLERP